MSDFTPTRILNKYFVLTWFVAFLLQIGQNLFSNTISVYIVSLGYSNAFAGSQALVYAAFAIAARFAGAYLCDYKSRMICMAAGCAAFAAASALFGIPALAFPVMILLLRGVQGFGYSLGTTGYFSASVDITPKDKVSIGLGMTLTAQGVAQLAGGVLAVVLVMESRYQPVFLAAAILTAAGVLFAIPCDYERKYAMKHRDRGAKKMALSDFIEKKAFRAALLVLVYYFGVALCMIFTVAAAQEQGFENGALFFTTAAIGMIIGNLGIVRIAERIGRIRTIVPLCFIAACCPLCVAFHTSMAVLLLGGFLYGITLSATPVIQAAAVESLPFDRRGAGTATMYIAMDITLGVGPFIWGVIIDASGYRTAFLAAAVVFAATAALVPFTLKKAR